MDFNLLNSALLESWSKETCYPPQQDQWTPENVTIGQCAVTALVVQDYLGGKILFNRQYNHFWNRLEDGTTIDLTKSQFSNLTAISEDDIWSRASILAPQHESRAKTRQRYNLLKKRVQAYLSVEIAV